MTGGDPPDDLDQQIDELAIEIEKTIAETQEYLDQLPEFEPRSQRSRKMRSMRNAV